MHPIHIDLEPSRYRALRRLAAHEGRTVHDLLHEAIDTILRAGGLGDPEANRRRSLAAIGLIRSEEGDLSVDHDRYLDEAYGT